MKRLLFTMTMAILTLSCSNNNTPNDQPETSDNKKVTISFATGNADYTPLSASKSMESGDLIAIQIYDITEAETAYAYGLFETLSGVSFEGYAGDRYRIEATVVKSATNKIHALDGVYGRPFNTSISNKFNYSTTPLDAIAEGGATLLDGAVYSVPNIDRYHCECEQSVTYDDTVIMLYLKRISFGLSNSLPIVDGSTTTIELNGAPKVEITDQNGYTIYTFADIAAAYSADESSTPYEESIDVVIKVGDSEVFNDKVVMKRNQAAALKYDQTSDSSFNVEFETGFEDSSNVMTHTITFEDEGGSTMWADLIPENQYNSAMFNSTTPYIWSDTTTGLSSATNTFTYESTDLYVFLYGGVMISNYYYPVNETTSQTSAQISTPWLDGSTGGCGNGGSKGFAVAFDCSQYDNSYTTALSFATGVERKIQSMYISNTSYTTRVCQSGEATTSASLSATDWVKLTVTGYNSADAVTSSVEYLLAEDGAVVADWNILDTSSLGAVNRVVLSISSSVMSGGYSTIPAYVAIDDITVEM